VLLPCNLGNARWIKIDGLTGVAGLRNYLLDPCLGSGWIQRDCVLGNARWIKIDGLTGVAACAITYLIHALDQDGSRGILRAPAVRSG
jgi:hypothetical protein